MVQSYGKRFITQPESAFGRSSYAGNSCRHGIQYITCCIFEGQQSHISTDSYIHTYIHTVAWLMGIFWYKRSSARLVDITVMT